MSVTVAKVLERISILRSKQAVVLGLIDMLKNNYLPNDAGDPEMVFTRSDFGLVPPEHVEETIQTLLELADTLESDLAKWGELEIVDDAPKKGKKNVAEKEGSAVKSESAPAAGASRDRAV
jgi:hypothetical protein